MLGLWTAPLKALLLAALLLLLGLSHFLTHHPAAAKETTVWGQDSASASWLESDIFSLSQECRKGSWEVCIVPKWPSWLNLVCGAAENGDVMWLCLCVTSRHAGRDMTGVAAF